jgi:hypothetical protein
MINRVNRGCDVISVVKETFDGTGVADLEESPVPVEVDWKESLGLSVEKLMLVGDPGKGCGGVVASPAGGIGGLESTCKVDLIADKEFSCCWGKGRVGASGGIGNFVMGPR